MSRGVEKMLHEAWEQETWTVNRRFKDALREMQPGMLVTADVASTWPNLHTLRSAGFISTANMGTGWFRVLRKFDGHKVGDLCQFNDPALADRMVRWQWAEHANVIPCPEFQCQDCKLEFKNLRGLLIHRARIHDVH